MVKTEDLDYSTFINHVNTEFRIHKEGMEPVSAKLAECEKNHRYENSFSLIFCAPQSSGILEQGSYKFDHDGIGAFELFMVPVLQDEEKNIHYQVVFQRVVPS